MRFENKAIYMSRQFLVWTKKSFKMLNLQSQIVLKGKVDFLGVRCQRIISTAHEK